MPRKYFGTDGIRGSANTYPMTSEVALKVGMAAGKLFTNGSYRHRVVIGKDTRLSGYMIDPRWSPSLPWAWTCSSSPDADARRRHADPLAPRRLGDDLRFAQPVRRQRHQTANPTATSLRREGGRRAVDGGSSGAVGGAGLIGRATRITARASYIEFAKRTLPKNI
jgi:phosphoglucosamine mutase